MSHVMEFYVRSKERRENFALSHEEGREIEKGKIRGIRRVRSKAGEEKARAPLRGSSAQLFTFL